MVVLSNAMLCGLVHSLKETLGAPVVSTLQGEEPFLDALPAPYSEQAWTELRQRADEIAADPTYQAMEQLQEDRVATVAGEAVVSSVSPPTALSLTYSLDTFVEALAGAVSAE